MKGKQVWAWAIVVSVAVAIPLGVLARVPGRRGQQPAGTAMVQLDPSNHFGVREPADREVVQLTQVFNDENSTGAGVYPVQYQVPAGKVLVVDHVSFFSDNGFAGPVVLLVRPQNGLPEPTLFIPVHSPVDLIPEEPNVDPIYRSPAHFRPFRSEADAEVRLYVPEGATLVAGVRACPHSCGNRSQVTVVGHLADYIPY